MSQPEYAPGDTAHFSAWYIDDEYNFVKGINTVTAEVINGNGEAIQRINFNMRDGRASNQIVFRNDIKPGGYRIVVFTDWMRNFGTEQFFVKDIVITARKSITVSGQRETGTRIAPEGGKMVAGINNSIVLVSTPHIQYSIIDSDGGTLLNVMTDSTGMAAFTINPVAGKRYFAKDAATGKNNPLPDVQSDGLALRSGSKTGTFKVVMPETSALKKTVVYPVVYSKGKIVYKSELTLTDGDNEIAIPPTADPGAPTILFVFNSKGEILAERIFFWTFPGGVDVRLNFPATVKQRDRIVGEITVREPNGNPLKADVIVSAIQTRLFPRAALSDENLYLADLPLLREWLSRSKLSDVRSINQFLAIEKWTRTDWQSILDNKALKIKYGFQSIQKLRGRVVDKITGEPAPDSTLVLAYLRQNTIGYEGYVKKGNFEIPFTFPFWGDDLIFCTIQNGSKNLDNKYDVVLLNDTLPWPARWTSSETAAISPYGAYAANRNLVTESYTFFRARAAETSSSEHSPNKVFEDEFQGVDYSVNVKDYVVFPTVQDLLHEVVPYVKYRKRGTEESVRVSYRLNDMTHVYRGDPLFIIDGMMTRNTAFFLALKPESLLTIKVLNHPNKLAQLGKLGANGIVFVESRKGDLHLQLDEDKVFPITGLSAPVPFSAGITSGNPGRLPDLRSTIYWDPSAHTTASGRLAVGFSASDDMGPVRVIVRGMTEDRRPFYAEAVVDVAFNPGE